MSKKIKEETLPLVTTDADQNKPPTTKRAAKKVAVKKTAAKKNRFR